MFGKRDRADVNDERGGTGQTRDWPAEISRMCFYGGAFPQFFPRERVSGDFLPKLVEVKDPRVFSFVSFDSDLLGEEGLKRKREEGEVELLVGFS
jgi:hypothetical protein